MQEQTFYYKFTKINPLLILNIITTAVLIYGFQIVIFHYCLFFLKIAVVFCGLGWIIWFWKDILPHKAVVIDDEGIRIDHCHKLKWSDIDYAEYKTVTCCFVPRKIISLVPKKDADIKLVPMQWGQNPYPPFSIPLYGILRKEDEAKIVEIINARLPSAIKEEPTEKQ